MKETSAFSSALAVPSVRRPPHPWLIVPITLVIVAWACQARWSLAASLPWHCDEIPLLTRFTGLCGRVSNEAESTTFAPSLYSFRTGALRALRVPTEIAAIHTTTNFWTNLTVHLWGATPGAGRAAPLCWSILAILAAAWAAWLVKRSVTAACLAAWFMALSPHAIAYAAQARGYSEAMALTLLLLIFLEHWRRNPTRPLGGVLVFLCALQLSLTVYTAWVYWVLPALLLAPLLAPRHVEDDARRATLQNSLVLTGLAVGAFMVVYTVDRWASLSFTAAMMGERIDSGQQLLAFLKRIAVQSSPNPAWVALLAFAGIGTVWRSSVRWWVAIMAAGVTVPTLLGSVQGSAGYPRNFGYLVGPLAILFGVGGDRILGAFHRWGNRFVVAALACGVLLAGSAWSLADAEFRARKLLEPDWGDVVMALDREPERLGPRWICRCLANHWTIDWYHASDNDDRILDVPPGGAIEVILGAQHDAQGRPIVYREDVRAGAIVEAPLPDYLARTPPTSVRSGVELRRWQGRRVTSEAIAALPSDSVALIVMSGASLPDERARKSFLIASQADSRGLITFKPIATPRGMILSLIAPASTLTETLEIMEKTLGASPIELRLFASTRGFPAE